MAIGPPTQSLEKSVTSHGLLYVMRRIDSYVVVDRKAKVDTRPKRYSFYILIALIYGRTARYDKGQKISKENYFVLVSSNKWMN